LLQWRNRPRIIVTYRYAIYAAPAPGSTLANRAGAWLGRDALTGLPRPQPLPASMAFGSVVAITREADRYGFHGTLKPPFQLARDKDETGLIAALEAYGARTAPINLGRLSVQDLSGFIALRAVVSPPALLALAADIVETFDGFRQPPDDAELSRRRANGLTPAQEANLERWGYPYVMDEFRLHFTLTTRLPLAERAPLIDWLSRYFAPALARPFVLDTLWLFVEPEPGAPFRQARGFALTGKS
jgi:putative phosphonate metabolism protein